MDLDREHFDNWMERIMDQFERIEKLLKNEDPDVQEDGVIWIDGVKWVDNQYICNLLNISKRTLQRYRNSKMLPFTMLYHKSFYKYDDLIRFIMQHFLHFPQNSDKTLDDFLP